MRKVLVSLVAALTLAAGGLAFALVNPFTSAGAQAPATSDQTGNGPLQQALTGLVQDGTLTQAQADAVKQRVSTEVKDRPHRGHHRRFKALREAVSTAAGTIGISPQDLASEVRSGKSIAQVAQEKGVDPKAVTDALVSKGTAAIDKAVADGKINTDRATKAKSRLAEVAQRIVDHQGGKRGN